MTTQTREIRVSVKKQGTRSVSYRFSVANRESKASKFLCGRYQLATVVSTTEAKTTDDAVLTTYGCVLADLFELPAQEEPEPAILAVHSAVATDDEMMELAAEPPVPVEQPTLFAEPGEEMMELGAEPPAALTAKKAKRMKLAELRVIAEQHGISTTVDSTKAEIIAALSL